MTPQNTYVRKGYLIGLLTTAVFALAAAWARHVQTQLDDKVDRTEFQEFRRGMDEMHTDLREMRRILEERRP